MNGVTDILDRLRARKKVAPAYSGSVIRSSGPNTPPISVSQPNPYPTTLVNPDGEEAAKLIEAAQSEAEALRSRVAELEKVLEPFPRIAEMDKDKPSGASTIIGVNIIRRVAAALASEPGK